MTVACSTVLWGRKQGKSGLWVVEGSQERKKASTVKLDTIDKPETGS